MDSKSYTIRYADDTEQIIECDTISPAGTLLMFINQTAMTNVEGQIQGYPVAFVDLNNPGVKSVFITPPVQSVGLHSV